MATFYCFWEKASISMLLKLTRIWSNGTVPIIGKLVLEALLN